MFKMFVASTNEFEKDKVDMKPGYLLRTYQ